MNRAGYYALLFVVFTGLSAVGVLSVLFVFVAVIEHRWINAAIWIFNGSCVSNIIYNVFRREVKRGETRILSGVRDANRVPDDRGHDAR